MSWSSIADAIWEGDSFSAGTTRAALSPLASLFGRVVARRNRRFDATFPRAAALPALSVGNLTVGGTGKTPVAAWCIEQLRVRGARPAIVMRGVGDDEWRVHGLLNPGSRVIVSPDRHNGLVVAKTQGADCAVLDDAFQHRQAARVVDIVLVSADRWRGRALLLPAGPFREPLTSLRRADVVVITNKAASSEQVQSVGAAIHAAAPDVPTARVRLAPGLLRLAVTLPREGIEPRSAGSRDPLLTHPPEWLTGRAIGAVSAIGDPEAFESQLRGLGAALSVVRRFPDHHRYTTSDAALLATLAGGSSGLVCTLKDAVKLGPLWPREAPPLWYLSQSVVVDRGAEALDRMFVRLLSARTASAPTAG